MKKKYRILVSVVVLILSSITLSAQNFNENIKERIYTLQSITVIADSSVVRSAGVVKVDLPKMQHMVTALGEGDVIKYIQTMPGIAAGVEGTSSFYVRGGNLGNNVVTIDGVRLYGYGHLLGITSAFSNDIVGSANFNVGGFGAESYNMLASHIDIVTKDPNFNECEAKFGVSNFMVSGYASAPIKEEKLALEVAARVSPLSLEYEMGKKWVEDKLTLFNNLEAGVYDIYGKLSYKPNAKHTVNASFFYSVDDFGYGDINVSSYDKMNWHNMIGNLEWNCNISPKWSVKTNASYNSYQSGQTQERIMQDKYNKLSITSSIEELSLNTAFRYKMSDKWNLKMGMRVTTSTFNPGSSQEYASASAEPAGKSNKTENFMGNLYSELKYSNKDRLQMALSLRGSYFIGEKFKYDEYKGFEPEVSFNASARLTKWMGIEATYDRLVQYYHTLEGIPLGWSLDMIVPSSRQLHPETGIQYYGGLYFKLAKDHRLSVGAYYKEMTNLIYFEKASEFFGQQAMSGWKDFINVGEGKSQGIEFLYQKSGKKLNYKVAYTFSETTRFFPELNDGKEFKAKFDRPHVLNATADYLFYLKDNREYGANLLLSYQSGNMESVKSGTYPGFVPGYDVSLDYYSGFNNKRLEHYMRVDVGAYAKWKKPKAIHNLQLGIYNLTNRHNIFSLYYDVDEDIWKKVYVFPIMPSISYKVEF